MLLFLLASGCASPGPSVKATTGLTTTSAKPTVKPTTKPAASVAKSTTVAAAPAAPAVDGATAFQQVVTGLKAGYDLVNQLAIDGKVSTAVNGRVIGAGSQLAVTTNGATVEYLQVPPTAWAREQGGTWSEMKDPAPVQEPLAVLGQPVKVADAAAGDGGRHLTLTYTAKSLGVAADGTIDAEAILGADGVLVVSYSTKVGDKTAVVTATLTPAKDSSPITAPA